MAKKENERIKKVKKISQIEGYIVIIRFISINRYNHIHSCMGVDPSIGEMGCPYTATNVELIQNGDNMPEIAAVLLGFKAHGGKTTEFPLILRGATAIPVRLTHGRLWGTG